MSIFVVGHTNPDSDSICGAISLAYIKGKLNPQVAHTPVRQGNVSPETAFILEKFGLKTPELKTSFANEQVYLIDFSDLAQAPSDIKEATILGIVDHHKLGDITTSTPLECWIRPVGCSNTIVKQMFDAHNITIPKEIAGMMCCAILSDTVIFKSPTCTPEDIKAVEELALIANIEDPKALGMEMFKVKSAVEGVPPRDLITRDYKDFNMSGDMVGVGQLEVVDLSVFDGMKEALFSELAVMKKEGNRHTIMLLLTDIIEEGSQLLALSDEPQKVQNAFNIVLENNQAWLPKVLSRKKQVIPFMEKAYAK